MISTINLIKDDCIEKIETHKTVQEVINDQAHKKIMNLRIVNNGSKELYHLFADSKKENSKIQFLKVDKFPDGIFFTYNEDNTVDCFICELKVTPSNKLKQLPGQMLSGYLHCKSLFSILDISKVRYNYLIFLVNDINLQVEYNNIKGLPKKLKPGTEITDNEAYQNWLEDKVVFKSGSFSIEFDIIKNKMNKIEPVTGEYEEYELNYSF